MLDDIIEAAIDIVGEVLGAEITSWRKRRCRKKVTSSPEGEVSEPAVVSRPKKESRKKVKTARGDDPWMRSTPDMPWEK